MNCHHHYIQEINELFQREFVGYRMIDNQITPISDDVEFEEINQAIENNFEGCRNHIKKALRLLSDREKPDYKNSIKESISAVESLCQIITNDSKATLGQTLNNVDEYKLAYPDTIVANSMNILIGSVGKCNYFGCVSPVYYVFKPKTGENIDFYNYIFQTQQFQKELRKYANGILEIRLRVSSSNILKREVAIPALDIQNKIVSFLDNKCFKIDELIALENQQIEKLKEYKQALITETVKKGIDNDETLLDSNIYSIGMYPLLFYKLIMFLQETRSIFIVTNRALSSWKEMNVDTHLIETLQKRLMQGAQIITLS